MSITPRNILATVFSRTIRLWLTLTGRTESLTLNPWLNGPMGGKYIGDSFYSEFAAENNLEIGSRDNSGLMNDFSLLGSGAHPNFQTEVARFYEQTSGYKMDVWTQSFYPAKLFARLLINTISIEINQLNIPLNAMDTSMGMSSEVIPLKTAWGETTLVCWLRKRIMDKRVVYCGFYAVIRIHDHTFVRVVFPLPDGNVTVILRPEFMPDGSFRLVSDRSSFGGAGYYRVQKHKPGFVKVKRIPLKEIIHVYCDENKVLRTDHWFWFLGMKMLKLHYKMLPAKEA
ncbi:MAG: hypothetical protein MUC87_16790 [Bacteroidia bacterium]|jgi:hypothetical protein|nr:hypothetical protein [Bacteroidia bacterium]